MKSWLGITITSVPECFQISLILKECPDILYIVSCVSRTSVVVSLLIQHGISSHAALALMGVCGEQDDLRWPVLFSYCNSSGTNRKEKKTFSLSQREQISNAKKK